MPITEDHGWIHIRPDVSASDVPSQGDDDEDTPHLSAEDLRKKTLPNEQSAESRISPCSEPE